mmetsp:Transcript_48196/g.114840  ORF Transcript_48196/g.114840 Transcript_48196/m.114840 type:complete len:240 (+) Transcript_48196:328-1047(+)
MTNSSKKAAMRNTSTASKTTSLDTLIMMKTSATNSATKRQNSIKPWKNWFLKTVRATSPSAAKYSVSVSSWTTTLWRKKSSSSSSGSRNSFRSFASSSSSSTKFSSIILKCGWSCLRRSPTKSRIVSITSSSPLARARSITVCPFLSFRNGFAFAMINASMMSRTPWSTASCNPVGTTPQANNAATEGKLPSFTDSTMGELSPPSSRFARARASNCTVFTVRFSSALSTRVSSQGGRMA